ncbi:MAG: hypothetical protein ACK4N6_05135, partial [Rhodocyclaceae bacterium]
PEEHIPARGRRETAWLLLVPPLVTATAVIAAGVFDDASWSPLSWAQLITAREYASVAMR